MIALIAIWVLGLMVCACKCVGYIFLAYFLYCLGSYCCNLFRYLVARSDNGYCYLIAFGRWRFLGAALCGAYPDVWHCANICSWVVGVDFFDDFKVTYNDGVLHLEPRAEGDPAFDHDWDCPLDFGQFLSSSLPLGAKAGAAAANELRSTASDARLVAEKIPIANDVKRSASKWVSTVRSEVRLPRPPRMPSMPHPKRRVAGDDEVREPFVVRRRLNAASAMEASKVLLSGMDVLGPSEERIPSALEAFPDGIATSVPPSAPQFERLTHMLGPLRYTPRTEGHAAAATLRRAALAHASAALQGAIVGLVSPSTAELHAFPMAVVWQYEDSLDASRNRKHCTLCRAPTCSVLQQAKGAGRHFRGQDWTRAAALFKRFEVTSLILTNIEPNMHARDLTQLMVSSGAYHAYSLVSVDWRVILGRTVEDRLIGMTTEQSFGKVVSSFSDGGDYVQSLGNVRALFAPTYAAGHALRRTIIFGEGASQFFELNLSRGGWATRCVPQHSKYYFIRLVMPNTARPIVLVEKAGFDRVLATFRTQAIKSKDTARITLRQSVVTYSISGTQVTPRLAVTGTEAEALAVWIEVYSEVQDAMAEAQSEAMKPRTATESVKSTVFNMVTDKLARSSAGAMALGSYSALQALINVYRTEIGEQTLEQMSDAAMVEHFGTKVQPESLQNSIVSKWGQVCAWARSPSKWVKLLNEKMRDSWATSFGYVDALAITALLSSVVSLRVMRVACDCLVVVCRIAGRTDVMNKVVNFIEHMDWQVAKASKFWVTIQSAQDLDFQAATIDIVETFFNVFGRDVAAEVQAVRESGMLTEEEVEELALTAALPYSDFLSEVKLFLGKFNSSVRRATLAASMLTTFRLDCRKVAPGQKEKMIHLLKQEMEAAKAPALVEAMAFALGGEPRSEPLPIRPIRGRSVRDAFNDGHLDMTCSEGKFTLHRLHQQGGVFDFSPIHALMDLQHGDAINSANLKGPNYLSPDERGAQLQEALIKHVVDHAMGARFVAPAAMAPWYTAQLEADGQIPYVSEILARQESLFTGAQAKNWRAHVTGLAMGGKSKGLRSWISSLDVVVVPTRQLKEEWQENLGKLDPVRRATVVTQHEALDVKYAARYVFIDECYAFDPEHLQAIANRHVKSKGVITIGDKRQIGNVFSVTGNRLQTAECPCVMITPTTFVGWDAAAVYLSTTTTDTFVEHLYCGSDNPESLRYALSSDDTLLPGQGDRAIQGTQVAKEMMLQRGVTCNTVHECQGSRTQNTVVHGLGRALMGDLSWLASPDQYAHCGVLITRARESTVFVVDGLEAMRPFRWFDAQVVNGALPTTLIYAGTSWDLVEPRTESESTWEHLHEPSITETHLEEVPLTDPVTIGTVFNSDGEALSSSEIRTNVELVAGVTLRDDGVAHSDEFDNYTIQPRDVPGADMVQALTRAIPDIRPTPRDFEDAEVIVQWIFEEVIDKKTFFAHVANSRRAAITRQTRQQVIDGCYASTETAASTLSFGFLKPEFAKKPSELRDGPSELKAQGVVSASDMQQAIFADTCDALTHAWARSMKRGKLSPVGYREEEVEDFLSTFTSSYELDIEKQDSSHRPVHVIVASIMLELASDKLGLGQLAKEIREERRVRMMGTPFKFVLNTALASGDPWTLIINKIMAVSSLISVAKLADVRMCQSGDDVTLDREPEWRCDGLRSQSMANRGLTWKLEEREQRRQGVTFISRAVLPNRTVVYKALRTILKYMSRPRNSIQHAGIQADALRVQRLAARHGLQAYAEARAQVWGGDPVVIFDMWTRALAVARAPFNDLPPELIKDEPRQYSIKERNGGCFGYALAQCVSSNVAAINAIAMYPTAVTITTALEACRDNKVGCLVMNETFANRSRRRLQEAMDRRHFTRAFVVVYEDHAVAVVPNTLTIHSGFGKRTISWKSSTSKDIEITDFE